MLSLMLAQLLPEQRQLETLALGALLPGMLGYLKYS